MATFTFQGLDKCLPWGTRDVLFSLEPTPNNGEPASGVGRIGLPLSMKDVPPAPATLPPIVVRFLGRR